MRLKKNKSDALAIFQLISALREGPQEPQSSRNHGSEIQENTFDEGGLRLIQNIIESHLLL